MILPEGTLKLNHQVAGHYHEANKSKLGILKHYDGSILKPTYEDERGKRENEFYKRVNGKNVNETDHVLRSFLPRYLGLFTTYYGNKEVSFIKLEDLTKKFIRPCILDVKICPRGNHRTIGFRIVGSRVYYKENDSYVYRNKESFQAFDSYEAVCGALNEFFSASESKTEIISKLLRKMITIEKWFSRQQSYVFNSSSLLVVYEGSKNCNEIYQTNKLKLKMIDFAHVYPSSEIDSNYALGLKNLMRCLQILLSESLE